MMDFNFSKTVENVFFAYHVSAHYCQVRMQKEISRCFSFPH